jgi:hypothetical protein
MKDAVGRDITLGDKVAYIGRDRRQLKVGYVTRIHTKMIGVALKMDEYPHNVHATAAVVIHD